jgi:MFS family permease
MADVLAAPQRVKADSALRTLTAISIAHWLSHFHLFVLPMLFPFLIERLGVSYIQVGFALTVFGIVSGLTQAPIGYLADHYGARKVLLIGLCVGGLALILLGLNLSYTSLVLCAALLGLANSVYHPCDYAILAAHMDEARMGRAFSIHTFAGFLGGAVAPAIMAALVATVGGLGALMVAGAVGPVVALLMIAMGLPDARAAARNQGDDTRKPNVLTPAIMMLTIFFMLLGLSNAGISSFGVVALMSGYGVAFGAANLALTCFLGASAIGVLAGGYLADRTERHGQVAAACFAINAAIVLVIAVVPLHSLLLTALMTTAGFLGGVIAPSRDMLVRAAAPPGAAGRAFGIVSTGFNFSGILAPLLYGFIMDAKMPHWVFGASVVFMLMTVLLALVTDRKARGPAEPAAVH